MTGNGTSTRCQVSAGRGAAEGRRTGLSLEAVSRLHHGTLAIADSVHRATAEFALGRLHCVVGKAGDGSATLLSLIAGYESPDAGTIRLECGPIAPAGSAGPDPRRIGVVLPAATLLAHLTVAENLTLAAQLAGYAGQGHTAMAAGIAAKVGLDSGSLGRLPGQLSLLEQRLACLARATAGDPAVILGGVLADDLDQPDTDCLFAALTDLARRDGRAVIVMTTSPAIARRADEVWFMRNGVLLPATM